MPPLVLVADDDPSILDLLLTVLGDEGYVAAGAADGERLMELLGHVLPSAILLDLHMPRLDGFGVIRQVMADPELRPIPIVAISAGARGEQSGAMGCRAFAAKPFDLTALLALLHDLVIGGPPLGTQAGARTAS
jgi:CheY-like chemotaxis protein